MRWDGQHGEIVELEVALVPNEEIALVVVVVVVAQRLECFDLCTHEGAKVRFPVGRMERAR
jgi:hypothetical protein